MMELRPAPRATQVEGRVIFHAVRCPQCGMPDDYPLSELVPLRTEEIVGRALESPPEHVHVGATVAMTPPPSTPASGAWRYWVDRDTIVALIKTLTEVARELPDIPAADHMRKQLFFVMAELEREGRLGYVTRASDLDTPERRADQPGRRRRDRAGGRTNPEG
jgi:hypothetical protein